MACCFDECTNTRKKNPKLTFFRFPKEKERRYLWMKKCNNPNIQNLTFDELQNRVVCEEHFLPKCFDYSVLASGKTRRSLFKFALPEPASVISALKKEEQNVVKKSSPLVNLMVAPKGTSASILPSRLQSKCKDLVSPQRLMNITENMCPLLRPISPPTCVGDDDNVAPPIPEISVIPLSDEEMYVKRESEKKPNVVQSLSSSGHILLGLITTTTTASTTTITTSTTTTTPSSTYVTLKAVVPKGEVNSASVKRPFSSKFYSDDLVTDEPGSRKYKKILPKHESSPETNFSSVHYIELPPIVEESEGVVLNLSGLGIQKLEKTCKGAPPAQATSLYLDNNLLQTLPTIDSYSRLSKLSLVNNQIDSLIWFGFLPTLRTLNLAKNRISNIDGLWKMWHLTHVNLSENKISILQGQASKPASNLEHLDISFNSVATIGDLSMLTRLKELLLHKNRLKTLIHCKLKLPESLTKLTLAENFIANLGDVVELSDLGLLKELTLKHNACNNALQLVDKQGNWVGTPRAFDYRPYVLTFCPSLTYLDDGPITVEERVKAEWLIDEGKLRTMDVQKHALLVTYLAKVCPKSVLSQDNDRTQKKTVSSGTKKEPTENIPTTIRVVSLNNNITSVNDMSQCKGPTLHAKKLLKEKKRLKSENRSTESDCSNEFPCKHYVELIEEKAKNYKLQRTNDSLMEVNEDMQHRIRVLETTLIENGFNIDDLFVKLEVDEEEHGI